MDDQQVQGGLDKSIGKAKETVGRVAGDTQTEAEGQNQQVEGQIRQGVGDLKDKAQQAGDRLRDGAERLGNAIQGNDRQNER